MTRRIGIVTTARSDFGIYRSLLRRLAKQSESFGLLVGGMHLSSAHGTVAEIESEGWPILAHVPMAMNTETPQAFGRSMGSATAAMADAMALVRPDLVVVLGDRFEMHAAALGTIPFKVPLAHIHGGELTYGALDDTFRHSMTKISHLHFPAAKEFARRIEQMGEEPWRINVVGAPSLDSFLEESPLTINEVELEFRIALRPSPILVTLHSETLGKCVPAFLASALVSALQATSGPVIITAPNADPGSSEIATILKDYAARRPEVYYLESVGARAYRTLLSCARMMVGNSSSGLIEAASFELPVVNIGSRQEGRMRPPNVIDADIQAEAVTAAMARADSVLFRSSLAGMTNPYGDGHAAERIADILCSIPLDERLLMKRFCDLPEARL